MSQYPTLSSFVNVVPLPVIVSVSVVALFGRAVVAVEALIDPVPYRAAIPNAL